MSFDNYIVCVGNHFYVIMYNQPKVIKVEYIIIGQVRIYDIRMQENVRCMNI